MPIVAEAAAVYSIAAEAAAVYNLCGTSYCHSSRCTTVLLCLHCHCVLMCSPCPMLWIATLQSLA